jgi:hypothetical protein
MLREEDVSTTQPCQERDRLFCFRYVRCKVSQEFGFDVLKNTMNHAQAIGPRRSLAYGLCRFDFREALEKSTHSFKIRVALRDDTLRGGN